jgi:hypothetical protein
VPIHLRAQVRQSNEFVLAFPGWYSLVMLPWLAAQIYFFQTIVVRSSWSVHDRSVARSAEVASPLEDVR